MAELQILRAITRLNIGGPGAHVLALARATPDLQSLLACGWPQSREGSLDASGVDLVRVALVRPISPVRDAAAIVQLRRLIQSRRPKLLESHMAKAGLAARAAVESLRRKPVMVHVFHGHVMEGYFSHGITQGIVMVERVLARTADVLVAVSPQTRDQLLDLRIGRPDQYRIVPLGLDLDPFLAINGPSGVVRARLGLEPGVPIVGVFGRLVTIKDHETLLAAVKRLPDVHLAVFGDGYLRPGLEEKVRKIGIGSRVHFLGWWSDVASAMADCDVVALSSRNEGTPLSLIEAQAAGRPVVATDVGGVASVVEEGRTGFLVPPGDPAALADRIGAVLSDSTTATRMGDYGRRLVASRFGLDRLVSDMRALYAELGVSEPD